MQIIDVTSFMVRSDRQVEFQRWFRENEARFAKACPPGISFGGCYVAIYGGDRAAGDTYWHMVADSYAALDSLAAAFRDGTSELSKLFGEVEDFMDTRVGVGSGRMLLKSLADASVWDVHAD